MIFRYFINISIVLKFTAFKSGNLNVLFYYLSDLITIKLKEIIEEVSKKLENTLNINR